jgi:hypothetical protein
MTVYIEKPALNLREELASLRNQGGYQEQQFYFDGLVTNGTFDADTNWTKLELGTTATTPTISGGVANLNRVDSGNFGYIYQTITVKAYATYTFSVTSTGGPVVIRAGNGALATNYLNDVTSVTGTKTVSFIPTQAGPIIISIFPLDNPSTLTVDNVSIFETDGTDVIHTMPKGWKPKDFYEDGLLQREGAANDYEVIYDGFDYVIKPTVAPSATTQTCVIGVKA